MTSASWIEEAEAEERKSEEKHATTAAAVAAKQAAQEETRCEAAVSNPWPRPSKVEVLDGNQI